MADVTKGPNLTGLSDKDAQLALRQYFIAVWNAAFPGTPPDLVKLQALQAFAVAIAEQLGMKLSSMDLSQSAKADVATLAKKLADGVAAEPEVWAAYGTGNIDAIVAAAMRSKSYQDLVAKNPGKPLPTAAEISQIEDAIVAADKRVAAVLGEPVALQRGSDGSAGKGISKGWWIGGAVGVLGALGAGAWWMTRKSEGSGSGALAGASNPHGGPTVGELSRNLQDINRNVEGPTTVTLITWPDGKWNLYANDERGRARRSDGSASVGTVPGVVRGKVMKFDAKETARDLIRGVAGSLQNPGWGY
jgi:hypothetical protein